MKKKYLLFPCWFLLFFSQISQAQERFKVAVVAGINFSQIDGDNFSGYEKFGIGGGLRSSVLLTEQVRLDFEMLYSQRGAYSEPFRNFRTTPHFFDVNLDYIEIPITGTYRWKELKNKNRKKANFYRYAAHLGITIGRLINLEIEEKQDLNLTPPPLAERLISFEEIEDKILRSDVGLFAGLSIYFTRHIGMTIRHSVSLTPLYSPRENENIGNKLINYYITTVGFYEF